MGLGQLDGLICSYKLMTLMTGNSAFPKDIASHIIALKKARLLAFHVLHPDNDFLHPSRSVYGCQIQARGY